MEKIFRHEYLGEYAVFATNKVKGTVKQHREWLPNTINSQHTGHAVVFGNGPSRLGLNWNLFKHHRGGLHASKKITTYGCNAMHRDCDPHFLVVKHPLVADEVVASGYTDNNIVITTVKNVLKHPDKFHVIPFDPSFCAGATALYLAAFDGHHKVYFVGFDGYDNNINSNIYAGTTGYGSPQSEVNAQKQIDDAMQVFMAYDNVEFIRVTEHDGTQLPEEWKYAPNVRTIGYTAFVSEVDLGVT